MALFSPLSQLNQDVLDLDHWSSKVHYLVGGSWKWVPGTNCNALYIIKISKLDRTKRLAFTHLYTSSTSAHSRNTFLVE